VAGCGAQRDDGGATRQQTARDRALTPAEQDSVRLLDEQRAGAHRDSAFAVQFRPVLADWEEAWARVIPGFRLDGLRWRKRDTLVVQPEHRIQLRSSALDSLTQRRWKLVFTPDRWLAVDPEFTRVFAPSGAFGGHEAEPAIHVYDFRARQRLTLTTGEADSPFEVTGWIGERRLVVAGWARWPESNRFRPWVGVYDLGALHVAAGMGPPVSQDELEAHKAMLELLIRQRSAPGRRP
jgi:hypothetical protein